MESSVAQLKRTILACKKCPNIVKTRSRPVPGFGKSDSKILFVGLAPGKDGADMTGIPFTRDPSGLLIDEMCKRAGISRELDVFITNLVKCNPQDRKGRNRTPSKKEIHTCELYLKKEIELINPKLIVPLGKAASDFFLGKNTFSMTEIHSKLFTYEGRKLIPFIHPGFVIRGAYNKKQYIDEFAFVGDQYLTIIEKEARLSRFDFLLMVLKNSEVNGRKQEILGKTRLQKFVFLAQNALVKKGVTSKYSFRPYYYGPFNRQLYTDIEWLRMNELVDLSSEYTASGQISKYSITREGRNNIQSIIKQNGFEDIDAFIENTLIGYSEMSIGKLVDYVHSEFQDYNMKKKVTPQKKLDTFFTQKII